MATQLQIPLTVKAVYQDRELDAAGKPTGKWTPVPAEVRRGKIGSRDANFNVVNVGENRRVLLTGTQTVSVPINNPGPLHTLRVQATVRKGRVWEADGAHRFVAPRSGSLATVDATHNAIIEEMPA